MTAQAMVELAKLLAKNDIDVETLKALVAMQEKPAAAPVKAQRKQAKRGYRSTAVAAAQGTQRKAKYAYGTAPTTNDAAGTMAAREDALEAAIPGLLKAAEVTHLGLSVLFGDKNYPAAPKYTDDPRMMANIPFTYVRLTKGQSIGNMSSEQVRAALAANGYGWSSANGEWGCDSNGRHLHHIRYVKAKRVVRQWKTSARESD